MARNVPDSSHSTEPNDATVNDATMLAPTTPSRPSPLWTPGETRVDRVQQASVVDADDRIRWGPVWAGLLTTLTSFLLLELLAYGLGLLTTRSSDGSVAASGASPWVTGAIGLIAFFLGGYLAERSAAARGGGAGLLQGFIVWALATSLILTLSILGLGSLFGALGNVAGQFLAAGGNVNTPGNVNVNGNQVAQVTQAAALGAFFSLLLTAIAAALGGMLGSPGRAIGFMRTRHP